MSRFLRRVRCTFGFHEWVQIHSDKHKNATVKGQASAIYENHYRCCNCTARQVRVITNIGRRIP